MTYALGVFVMAAGASSRFGSPKQLASINGTPMLLHSVNRIQHTAITQKSCVLGANAEQVSAILPSDVKVYRSVNWQDGLSASLRVASTNLPDNCTHVLIALGDQIAISTTEYHQLIEHSIQNPNHIVCARYAGRNGVPAIFPVSYMPQLKSLSGDKGAGQLLNMSVEVETLDFDSAAHDIDTPDDLLRVLSILK